MHVMTNVTIERTKLIDADTDRAWGVIGDLGGYLDQVVGLRVPWVMAGEGWVRYGTASIPTAATGTRPATCGNPALATR